MPRRCPIAFALLASLAFAACRSGGVRSGLEGSLHSALPTIAEKTQGLERVEGLIVTWRDTRRGKLWLELPAPVDGEHGRFLYVEGLVSGLGSNPIGLDRGQLGPTRLVILRRVGGRVLVEQPNLRHRAVATTPEGERAVAESFASSVLWAQAIEAEDADGSVLVDFTSFVVRDAHGVAQRLKASEEGDYSLDEGRSALDVAACLTFPDNLELEAVLTFSGSDPGPELQATLATPGDLTLVQHHSLLRLPDDGYAQRSFDPRMGAFSISFFDHAAGLDEDPERRLCVRHRLQKTGEPLVYHVDRAAPEPVRSALMEGAGWWAQAFEAAGFPDGFRVELLPAEVHPLDARYNVIQWVHRATRGWSYGGGVVDPRTGERIKGHVSLGALRVRQDRLLFEGLLGADGTGSGAADDPIQLALARIRQLAAHEVGHTLGLAHNFASSFGRASVMDYPAPLIRITPEGELDSSGAYAIGVGTWDVHAIRLLYGALDGDGEDEARALDEEIRQGLLRGLDFLSDRDARPAGAAQPRANLWDNGDDPVESLEQALAVRAIALQRFGEHNVAPGRPLATLHEVLVPVYLHHRYQLEAAVKVIGGLEYRHALRSEESSPPARPIEARRQRRALEVLLDTLAPSVLDLPDSVLELLLPRPPGFGENREMFVTRTAPAFDALGAAASAADLTLSALLNRARCARLVDFHRRDPELPGLEELLETLTARVFAGPRSSDERIAELERTVQSVAVARLLHASAEAAGSHAVRARIDACARRWLEGPLRPGAAGADAVEADHRAYLADRIERHLQRIRLAGDPPSAAPELPPGSPIGSATGQAPSGHLEACSHSGN